MQTILFLIKQFYFSRLTFVLYFILAFFALSGKRVVLRLCLRRFRKLGYNQKHVLLLGNGPMAERYVRAIASDPNLGFLVDGYLAEADTQKDLGYLGTLDQLSYVLSRYQPDEVVAALSVQEFSRIPSIIECCEKEGVKLSIIPFFAHGAGGVRLDRQGHQYLRKNRHQDFPGSVLCQVYALQPPV